MYSILEILLLFISQTKLLLVRIAENYAENRRVDWVECWLFHVD